MRHELSPFEGDLVSVTGWIKEWRKNRSDETDDICIVNASLTRWDGSSAVDIFGCEAKVHHIWIRVPKNTCDAELLEKVQFLGKVGYYCRADGSVDLGVRGQRAVCMDVVAKDAFCWLDSGSWKQKEFSRGHSLIRDIDFCLECTQTQGIDGFAYSIAYDCKEACRRLTRYRTQIQRFIDANLERNYSLRRPKPQGLSLHLPSKSARPRHAAGFA